MNGWIGRAEFRALHLKLSASLKKSATKRSVWLESQREKTSRRARAGSWPVLIHPDEQETPQATSGSPSHRR